MAPYPRWQVPERSSYGPPMAPYASRAPVGTPPQSAGKALVAMVLGLSSMACLGAFTGIPAIVLGALARKEIDRSGGQLTGSNIAAFGIVTGLFGTGLSIVLGLMMVGGA